MCKLLHPDGPSDYYRHSTTQAFTLHSLSVVGAGFPRAVSVMLYLTAIHENPCIYYRPIRFMSKSKVRGGRSSLAKLSGEPGPGAGGLHARNIHMLIYNHPYFILKHAIWSRGAEGAQ